MTDFVREGACERCGREYMVAGASLNPGAETEAPATFRCACSGRITAFVPGSVNREKLVVRPKEDDEAALA